MKFQVSGQVMRTNKGTYKKGPLEGQVWYRVDVAEVGATHSIPVSGVDHAAIKAGSTVVISGDLVQRHNARGQYVNEGYEIESGTLQSLDGQAVKRTA